MSAHFKISKLWLVVFIFVLQLSALQNSFAATSCSRFNTSILEKHKSRISFKILKFQARIERFITKMKSENPQKGAAVFLTILFCLLIAGAIVLAVAGEFLLALIVGSIVLGLGLIMALVRSMEEEKRTRKK